MHTHFIKVRLLTFYLCIQKMNTTVGKKSGPYLSHVRNAVNYSRSSCCLLRRQIATVEEAASSDSKSSCSPLHCLQVQSA